MDAHRCLAAVIRIDEQDSWHCPTTNCPSKPTDRNSLRLHIIREHHLASRTHPAPRETPSSASSLALPSAVSNQSIPKFKPATKTPTKLRGAALLTPETSPDARFEQSSASSSKKRWYNQDPSESESESLMTRKRPRLPTSNRSSSPHEVEDSNYRIVLIQIQGKTLRLEAEQLQRLGSGWLNRKFSKSSATTQSVFNLDEIRVTAEDFSKLLGALDEPRRLSFDINRPLPTFKDVSAILRTAIALQCEAHANWALDCVKKLWSNNVGDIALTLRPHAVDAIQISRLHDGLRNIVKSAFYELVRDAGTPETIKDCLSNNRLTAREIAMLVSARDKCTVKWSTVTESQNICSLERFPPCSAASARGRSADPVQSRMPLTPMPTPPSVSVIPRDRNRQNNEFKVTTGLVAARRRLFETSSGTQILKVEEDTEPTLPQHSLHPVRRGRTETEENLSCISGDIDRLNRTYQKLVEASGMRRRFHFDPVCGIQALVDAGWEKEGMCTECVHKRQELWKAERQRLWAEMDWWFGIDGT
ncbi:hypothetical protein H0H92_006333 [Tricholoma furcatifolium]|nr:hypothetical protein H0H92_006333 [Tricholoma furcatifolium]